MLSLDADFKSGLMFYFDPFISTDRTEGRRPFASLDFGPKDGGRIALRFFAVDDIAALASALYQLGRDFAEKCGPDEAEVPLFEEVPESAPITEPLTL